MVRAQAVDDQERRHRFARRRALQFRHGVAGRAGVSEQRHLSRNRAEQEDRDHRCCDAGLQAFEDLGNGKTKYRAVARHWSEETMRQHQEMGFEPGWTQTARQLEELAQTI